MIRQLLGISKYTPKQSCMPLETYVDKYNNSKYLGLADTNLSGSIEFYNKCKKLDIKPLIGQMFYCTLVNNRGDQYLDTFIVYAYSAKGYSKLCELKKDWLLSDNNRYFQISTHYLKTHDLFAFCPWQDYIPNTLSKDNYVGNYNITDKTFGFIQCSDLNDSTIKLGNNILSQVNKYVTPKIELPKDNVKINDHLVSNLESFLEDRYQDYEFNRSILSLPAKSLKDIADPNTYFIEHVYKKALQKLGTLNNTYKDRLDYEIETIIKLGFVSYFCCVEEIMAAARLDDITFNFGRGSAGGSLVSYVLSITGIDPIEHNLIFERFLDPSRVSPPDIDIDVADVDRPRLLALIADLYGYDHVGVVGNVVRLAFKSAFKDVARLKGLAFDKANEYTKYMSFKVKSKKDLLAYPYQAKKYREDELYKEIVDAADLITGTMRQYGIHAGGVIISPQPIWQIAPCTKTDKSPYWVTELDKNSIESTGLLKMDFLGLTALTTVKNTLTSINAKNSTNYRIDKFKAIDFEDLEIYKLLKEQQTAHIFQLDGGEGISELAQKLAPENLNDMSDLVALYRPAVLDSGLHELYLQNRYNPDNVQDLSFLLHDITKNTFGILLYQEQLMQAARKLAGFSMSEADELRKIIGKKQLDKLPAMKSKFLSRCETNNTDLDEANKVWQVMENAGRYCFNHCLDGDYVIPELDIKISDMHNILYDNNLSLFSINEEKKVLNKNAVEDVLYTGQQEVFDIELSNGEHIQCTLDHKFLCSNMEYYSVREILEKDLELFNVCTKK